MTQIEDREKLLDEHHELMFGIRRSIRYHSRRMQFFDKWNKIIKFFTVISGLATFTTVLAELDESLILACAVMVAFISTFDLIIGTGEKGGLHKDLADKFIDLQKDVVQTGEEVEAEKLVEFKARRLDIEMEEPPIKNIIDIICHNELILAMGVDESEMLPLRWYQRLFANFTDIQLHIIKPPNRGDS